MHSRIYAVVVILLNLGYGVSVSNSFSSSVFQRETKGLSIIDFSRNPKRTDSTKIYRSPVFIANTTKSAVTNITVKASPKRRKNVTAIDEKTNKLAIIDLRTKTKKDKGKRGARRKHRRKRRRVLMALLLAYKLKFAALVPAMIGGLALLVSTTALAGFFFALFAAVLGLKAH